MKVDLNVKWPLFLFDLKQTWIFSTDFCNPTLIQNFTNRHSMGTKMHHVDRREDGHYKAKLPFTTMQMCLKSVPLKFLNIHAASKTNCHKLHLKQIHNKGINAYPLTYTHTNQMPNFGWQLCVYYGNQANSCRSSNKLKSITISLNPIFFSLTVIQIICAHKCCSFLPSWDWSRGWYTSYVSVVPSQSDK